VRKTKIKYIPVPVAVPQNFEKWPLMILYSTCIWGEGRGEPKESKAAIAWVIRNRWIKNGLVMRYGDTIKEVILKPLQFSCFNHFDPNRKKLFNPLQYDTFEVWAECFEIAEKVHTEEISDPTNGATHYHHKDMKVHPKWTEKMIKTAEIGSHIFYKYKGE